uniref:DUF1232 domain-containing protein n=1 Tax=uncultured Armatimonadetes bacterium TaxID=157466 RepID=A0A6J4I0F3_9BACT|nr:hypothetical protein AVDCRST_MAG63-1347 [uncultured Armatimonadetes bacterium]
MHRLRSVGKDLKRELKVYRLVLRDERTPRSARFLLGLAVGYTLLPFDLIPDFLPIIGHLDDVIIVPALVSIALKRIPQEVVQDCRSRAGGAETTPRTA